MGVWRNKSDEEGIYPTAGVTVLPDETFTVPDADDDAYARNINLAPVDGSAQAAQDTVDAEQVPTPVVAPVAETAPQEADSSSPADE